MGESGCSDRSILGNLTVIAQKEMSSIEQQEGLTSILCTSHCHGHSRTYY